MTPQEIFSIIEEELGVSHFSMANSRRREVMDAKYIAILMMSEEGLNTGRISEILGGDRSSAFKALELANTYLGNYRPLKIKYLACIANMARREDQNEKTEA